MGLDGGSGHRSRPSLPPRYAHALHPSTLPPSLLHRTGKTPCSARASCPAPLTRGCPTAATTPPPSASHSEPSKVSSARPPAAAAAASDAVNPGSAAAARAVCMLSREQETLRAAHTAATRAAMRAHATSRTPLVGALAVKVG